MVKGNDVITTVSLALRMDSLRLGTCRNRQPVLALCSVSVDIHGCLGHCIALYIAGVVMEKRRSVLQDRSITWRPALLLCRNNASQLV